MGILKPMGFDSYAYQIGTFPIASTDIGKIKDGMFCKLNAKSEVCLAGAGEKGFMVLFPKRPDMQGFAISQAAFYVGPFTLNIDEECFDATKTYKAQENLYINADGKLTNDSSIAASGIPVAQVLRPTRTFGEKKALAIATYNGII